MTTEIVGAFLRANLVISLAILAVLALRGPLRRLSGPELAYGLWAVPPIAFVATLMPPPTLADEPAANILFQAVETHAPMALMVWSLGFAAFAWLIALAQARFLSAARAGRVGPSVVGVINPRIVMPADDSRYSPEERALVRAHERQHVSRGDPRARALTVAFQALCWFNPMVHLAAHVMRLDQELACDAGVLRHRPRDRALYARTLLKTQMAAQALPFGCHWPARGAHPLEVRVAQLKAPPADDGMAGHLFIAVSLFATVLLAWNAQPPGVKHPPPMLTFWEHQQRRAVSVLLISSPPRERAPVLAPPT